MTAHTASSKERLYAAIDLKSFYASVECMDRGLDPLTTNLVVADKSPYRKNHLSGSVSFSEIPRHLRPRPPV